MSLAEAVHKITLRPALRYGISDRGTLTPGAYADLTIFNANTIDSPATYEKPDLPPVGISYVFRNGQLLLPSAEETPQRL